MVTSITMIKWYLARQLVNRAYELESQIAIYPRIVIDNSVLDFFDATYKMLKNDQAWQNDWRQVQKLMKR